MSVAQASSPPIAIRLLFAAACIVIIIAGGMWLADRNRAIAAAEAEAAALAAAANEAVSARAAARADACSDALAERDAGNMVPFVAMARGGDILAEVSKCRETVARGY